GSFPLSGPGGPPPPRGGSAEDASFPLSGPGGPTPPGGGSAEDASFPLSGPGGPPPPRGGRTEDVVLRVENLVKLYSIKVSAFRSESLHAVDGVSLSVRRRETLGLVGESGCGKSTLGRLALRLEEPTAGAVRFQTVDLTGLGSGELRRLRPKLQMVFQDPLGSLNPRMKVWQSVAEPLRLQGLVNGGGV